MKNIAIKENHLYQKAYTRGKRFVGKHVAIYVLKDYAAGRLMKANPEKCYVNRVGLSVSKKIGGAVVRNRTKRIIRAAYDTVKGDLRTGFLVVMSARVSAVGKKMPDIERDLRIGFSKLDMFVESPQGFDRPAAARPDPSSDGQTK